jgi:hypothetical protein
MSVTLVYVTYGKDLPWFKYSLQSIHKFVTGASEILIYYHDECEYELSELLKVTPVSLPIRVIPVHYEYHGYIKQMVVKLQCWRNVTSSHVMYIDSDCIFDKPYQISNISDKRIEWYYEDDISTNRAFDTWKHAVKRMTGAPMTKYYMANAFPFIVSKVTLENAESYFTDKHKESYDSFCMKEIIRLNIPISRDVLPYWPTIARVFEEFEYLGWYVENFTNDCEFYTGTRRNHYLPLVQFWSHGGITREIQTQIERILA